MMNYISIVADLINQLESQYKSFFQFISNEENISQEDIREELNERSQKIKTLASVIQKQIQKIKSISRIENEIHKTKQLSTKYDEKLAEMNKILTQAVEDLTENNNLFKLSSTQKNVIQSNFQPRDLINFTKRINTNYSLPQGLSGLIPGAFLNPYPTEEKEFKQTFLKFNFDEASRLKMPLIKPESVACKKGTIIEIKYPDNNIQDVFFRYTLGGDLLPAYFHGEMYNSSNPPIIDSDMIIKVCACKYGLLDSKIRTVSYQVTDEESRNIILKQNVAFARGAMRPDIMLNQTEPGISFLQVSLEDDDASLHQTPGSVYPMSVHKRESNYMDNDDGL